jgi:hypothetical protein
MTGKCSSSEEQTKQSSVDASPALGEFQTANGVNVPKYRSFELFRRHTWRPEIVTFDELLQRARFIVEHGPEDTGRPVKPG